MVRPECRLGLALVLAMANTASPAHGCPVLAPGLRAGVRPLNLDAPVPVNGALVFEVDCWHDCTPCAAAEQRLDVTVIGGTGHSFSGDRPEQVFMAEDGLRHLVLWRFAEPPPAGAYQLTVGVRGQDPPASYPLTLVEPAAEIDAGATLSASTTTYEVERGALYTCDQSTNDCSYDFLSFGSQVESLPALALAPGSGADEATRGQLLYHVMHHAADGSQHWGSWRLALDMPSEVVRFSAAQSEYCADTEVRSLLANGGLTAATPCVPHGDLAAPLTADTDITSKLTTCLRPPSGLEPEWCAAHEFECASSSPLCSEVTARCVEPIARGSTGMASDETDFTYVEPAELCPTAADTYDDETVAGCTCRASGRRAPRAPLATALLAALCWFVRRGSKPGGWPRLARAGRARQP